MVNNRLWLNSDQRNWVLARNIIIYDELKKVLLSLNSAGIKVIVLAGAALAETVYPDMGLRPMSDIDLLVYKTNLPKIEHVRFAQCKQELAKMGYSLKTSRKDEVHFAKTCDEFTLHIDVHFNLPYLRQSGLKEVCARAPQTTLVGIETLVLSPEDSLIYVVIDALTYHGGLSQICLNDILFISNHIDWTKLIRLIKQYHLEAPMYYAFQGLKSARHRVAPVTGIPEWVLKTINPHGKQLRQLRVYQFLLGDSSSVSPCFSSSVINSDLGPIIRFITCPGRFRLLLSSFLPPIDFMVERYGLPVRGLSYLYYPVRVLSHFWRVVKVAAMQR